MEQAVFSLKDYRFDKVTLDFSEIVSQKIRLSIDPLGVFDTTTKTFTLTFVFNAFAKADETNDLAPEKNLVNIRCVADFEFQNINGIVF